MDGGICFAFLVHSGMSLISQTNTTLKSRLIWSVYVYVNEQHKQRVGVYVF